MGKFLKKKRYVEKIIINYNMKNLKLFENFLSTTPLPIEEAVERSMSGSKKPILLLTNGSGARETAPVADDLGGFLCYLDIQFMSIEDLEGLPSPDGKTYLPQFLPYGESNSPIILLFSGAARANRQVLNFLMNLAITRKTRDYTLPENCIVVMSLSLADRDAEHFGNALMDRFILAKG